MENKTQATHPDSDPCGGTHQVAQLPPAPPGALTRRAEGHWSFHGAHRPRQGSGGGGLEWRPSSSPAPDASCTPSPRRAFSPPAQPLRKLSPGEAPTAEPGQEAVSSESSWDPGCRLPASSSLTVLSVDTSFPRMGEIRHLPPQPLSPGNLISGLHLCEPE